MPEIRAAIEIARLPDEVFAAVADPETRRRLLPDNFTNFRVVSEARSGPGTRTAFRIITGQGTYESEIELTDWDPPRALTERALGESPYTMRWTFDPVASGTSVAVTMAYRVEGTLLHRLVERWFARRALEQSVLVELIRLKQLLEA